MFFNCNTRQKPLNISYRCKIYRKKGLTPLCLYGKEGLVAVLSDHLFNLVQQDRHTPVFARRLTVQYVVIVPTVFQQSLQLASASEDVLLNGRASQPVTTAEQHHGVEARAVAKQSLYVRHKRSPLPGGEGRDDGEDQQQGVGSGPQEGSPALGLLADSLRGSPHREPVPARRVYNSDPTTRHERLPPEAQLCLLSWFKVAAAQDAVPHRAFSNTLPTQQQQPQF